jgi:hypothetical protein
MEKNTGGESKFGKQAKSIFPLLVIRAPLLLFNIGK